MSNNQETSCETVQELLFTLSEPIIFKNILCTTEGSNYWKLNNWSLIDFANKCGDQKLPFRVGKNAKTSHPQWEVETPIEYKTMKEFLNDSTNDTSKWFYFDYKYVNQWFQDNPDILNSFNWKLLNLEYGGSDSTIWIGSKGAHTNCHQDTYGCNLIAQTHGRKLWLLFSPECSDLMQPTRIPYEESTIYSKYNFFSPSENEIQVIKNMSGNVKFIILEANDVLFVPKGWWHYVESLETSLSVNIWLPLEEDCHARLTETLVNLIISTIGIGIPKAVDQPESNLSECFEFIKRSLQECQKLEECSEPLKKQRKLNQDNKFSLQSLVTKYPNNIRLLPDLNSENINDFIQKNDIIKHEETITNKSIVEFNESSRTKLPEEIIDAFCHPSVIMKVSQILTNKLVKQPNLIS